MSSSTTSQNSSISHHLRAIKKILQDTTPKMRVATAPDKDEVDALERDIFEVLFLIRSWKNMVAPINKIPPEILAVVPDFLGRKSRDRDLIALTHVCRAWREVFVARSSLWVDFDCKDGEKTRVYLERSKSSPINLSLDVTDGISISPCDPFFQVVPRAIGRLKSLSIEGTPKSVQAIIAHLSQPAPILRHLEVYGTHRASEGHLTLTSIPFNGDLSSLSTLRLDSVRTDLPWRNMTNLTSFTLIRTPPGGVTIKQLLDFFEGAPHLSEIDLRLAIPTTGTQYGRLVSLVCLKRMFIWDDVLPSVLLDHLMIPVGAKLIAQGGLLNSLIGEHLPRSLDNLRNFSNFTTIQLYPDQVNSHMIFSGPNGEVTITPHNFRTDRTDFVLGSLVNLDTSKTERLEINGGKPQFRNSVYQALLPMKDLCTLTLSECANLKIFIRALHPGMGSSKVVVCPKLEELVIVLCAREEFDVRSVTEMAAARALRGGKLRTVKIVDGQSKSDLDVSELKKHVWNVEYSTSTGVPEL